MEQQNDRMLVREKHYNVSIIPIVSIAFHKLEKVRSEPILLSLNKTFQQKENGIWLTFKKICY